MTRTNVRIMSLSTGSCSYHIRVISATVSRAKFVRVDYFETVKITDTDKCPYQIRIASVSCPPCIRVVLVTFVSHPWHFLARIHTRIWQGYDTDTTRTLYGCNNSRRHRAAHVESQIVPLFPQSLTIRVVGSVLNDARRRYEKCIVLGQ